MAIVIVDLDGTLANIDHRLALVKDGYSEWDAFFNLIKYDTPYRWCVELVRVFDAMGHKIHFVSARPKRTLEATHKWLHKHLPKGMDFEVHIVREDDDSSQDVVVKRKWLKTFGKENILFVVDDRDGVVDMWREEGLVCLQCQKWDE